MHRWSGEVSEEVAMRSGTEGPGQRAQRPCGGSGLCDAHVWWENIPGFLVIPKSEGQPVPAMV